MVGLMTKGQCSGYPLPDDAVRKYLTDGPKHAFIIALRYYCFMRALFEVVGAKLQELLPQQSESMPYETLAEKWRSYLMAGSTHTAQSTQRVKLYSEVLAASEVGFIFAAHLLSS